jgi:hypothetical protein
VRTPTTTPTKTCTAGGDNPPAGCVRAGYTITATPIATRTVTPSPTLTVSECTPSRCGCLSTPPPTCK